jgi:hypothetical protein
MLFPVTGDYRISSKFGPRQSPGGIGSRNHMGLDIAAPIGTGVIAPVSGTVTSAGNRGGYGNLITLQGNDGVEYRFAHLNSIDVKPGMAVNAGSMIGTVGNTGNSTGPHLHFETRKDGKAFDPQPLLRQGKSLLDKGISQAKEAAGNAVVAAATAVGGPAAGAVASGVKDAIGLNADSCGIICQIQKWLKESEFFERIATALLAIVLIWAAFALFSSGVTQRVINQVAKG